jgi:hypothetical protein
MPQSVGVVVVTLCGKSFAPFAAVLEPQSASKILCADGSPFCQINSTLFKLFQKNIELI